MSKVCRICNQGQAHSGSCDYRTDSDLVGDVNQLRKENQTLVVRVKELERVLGEVAESLIPIVRWTNEDCYCISEEEILVSGGKTCPTCYAKEAIAEIQTALEEK